MGRRLSKLKLEFEEIYDPKASMHAQREDEASQHNKYQQYNIIE